MKKHVISFVLALCAVLSLVSTASATSSSYVINGVSVSPSSGTSVWNCSTYASEVLKKIWVVNAVMTTYGNPYNLLNGKSSNERRITEDNVRKYIQATPLGSRIRICASSDTTTNNYDNSRQGHTMVLAAKNDVNGTFTVLEAGSGFAADSTFTYGGFADYWANRGYKYFFYISDYSAAATNVISNTNKSLTEENPWYYSMTPSRDIFYAVSGNDVKWLQQALNLVMGSGLAVDGSAGLSTSGAIREFQSKYHLSVDGIFGPASRQTMVNVLNSMGYTLSSNPENNVPVSNETTITVETTKNWSTWSDWSTAYVTPTDTREVESRDIKISDGHTEYRYGRYIDSTKSRICWCGKYLESQRSINGNVTLQYSNWSTIQYNTTGTAWTCGYCRGSHVGVHHISSDGRAWWAQYELPSGNYYWEESRWVEAKYETQYRYRDALT